MNEWEIPNDLLDEIFRKEEHEVRLMEYENIFKGDKNMAILYQQVRWNNVFEVLQDKSGNLFIFQNGHFWKAPSSLDEAKLIISKM
jgi:hypothetical protein